MVLAGGVGCSDSEPYPRDAAVAQLATDRGWTEREAGCWVDRVLDAQGAEVLDAILAGGDDPAAVAPITVDCVAADKLPTSGSASTTSPTVAPGQPARYGDDPELDALWDACAAGDGAACDALFDAAPLGSDYERFGSTCGDRGVRPRCAE